MAQEFLNSIDLMKTELRNARVQNLSGAPASPRDGQIYFNTVSGIMHFWSDDAWYPMTGMNWKRTWNASASYVINDAVDYNGTTYVLTSPSATVGTPPVAGPDWDIIAAGGMLATYTNLTPMPVALGGLPAGTTFNNRSIQSIFDGVFYPYQAPGFSSFSMTGPAAILEVGTGISGSKTFTWATSNSANVQAGSVQILQGSTVIASGLNASGSTTVTIPSITNNSPTSQTWTIKGTNTVSGTFQTTFTVTWQYKRYWGTSLSTTLDSTAIQALANSSLSSVSTGTFSFAAGGFKYFVVPVPLTAPSSIKDAATLFPIDLVSDTGANSNSNYNSSANGLNYAAVSVTNSLGVVTSYRVYRSRYELGSTMNFVVA